jgi:uncharacterized protein (TIGR02453 family)
MMYTPLLDFLSDLQQNNNKEWMDANRERYLEAKALFEELVTDLLAEIVQFDESLVDVMPKDCIFRINRDVRFSKNKAPYKDNFGAAMSEGGRHSNNADYYIHIQPNGESFLGGGIYMPPGEVLKKIRQEIDYNAPELKSIVEQPDFKDTFKFIQGEKLKRAPRGYDENHPNIEFLKLKSFVVLSPIGDEELAQPDFAKQVARRFKIMSPFINYLNVAAS